jgi:hypothetical protein
VSALVLALEIGEFTRDSNLGGLDRDEGADERVLDDGECCIAGSVGEVAKLSAFGKYLLAGPDVDGEGYGNDNPNRAIECRNTEEVPIT